MPYINNYNERKFEKYHVDYDILFNELTKNSVSKSRNKYIKEQLTNLIALEAKPIAYAPKVGNKLYIYKFSIGSVELFINFNIEYIKRFLNDFKQPIKTIDIEKFGLKDSPILYTDEPYNYKHLKSTQPIIIAPFNLNGKSEYIVLDGNHRISAKKQHNIDSVNCYIHMPNKNFEFCFEYDRILYLFITSLYN